MPKVQSKGAKGSRKRQEPDREEEDGGQAVVRKRGRSRSTLGLQSWMTRGKALDNIHILSVLGFHQSKTVATATTTTAAAMGPSSTPAPGV